MTSPQSIRTVFPVCIDILSVLVLQSTEPEIEKTLGKQMESNNKNPNLEQELRSVKKELVEKEAEIETYKSELGRLNQEVTKLLMGLDKDLASIRDVFKYIVPSRFPHINGFQFSSKYISGMRFNGDYIDIFEQKDRFKFNLIMSTTTGPSLTALLIGFLLKFGRDFGEHKASSPDDFINKVIDEIKDKKENPSDIQLACALVDKRTYEISCKTHGGIKCYFQSGDQKADKNTAIKVLTSEDQRENIKLNPYDRFVMASPGLFGAPNEKGQVFGAKPILESMEETSTTQSVHDLRNNIFHKLDRHLGGRKPMQDVSLVIMSVENNIIKLV